MSDTTNSAVQMLEKLLAQLPAEIVDGHDVRQTADMVMLDVAYTPVIPYAYSGNDPAFIPTPCEVFETRGTDYIVRTEQGDEKVGPESLKVMRARYLLWNAYLIKMCGLDRMSYRTRQEYVAKYHNGSLFIPKIMVDMWKSEEEVQ